MSADIVPLLTTDEAHRLTERIRTALDRFSTSWADLAERVGEAYERRADLALGYGSWAEYASAEFHPAEGLAASVRQQVVGLLSAQGMSTRAIAPVVGVSDRQVRYDREVGSDFPPAIDFTTGEVLEASTAAGRGEAPAAVDLDQRGGTGTPSIASDVEEQEIGLVQPPAPRPAQIVGLDGKSYSRPAPSTPKRAPLRDGFRDASLDLGKLVARFERLVADDRYPRNRDEVAPFRNDLIRARDALDGVIELMSN